MGVDGSSNWEEGNRLQVGLKEERSNIGKTRGTNQDLFSSKGLFTKERD